MYIVNFFFNTVAFVFFLNEVSLSIQMKSKRESEL